MRYSVLAIFSILPLLSVAQDRTISEPAEGIRNKGRILVIPNDPTMHRSNIDPEIARANGTSVHVVRNFIRYELGLEIATRAAAVNTSLLLDPGDGGMQQDLEYVYVSTGYKAEPLPVDAEMEASQPDAGTKITRGQLTVSPQRSELYMRTVISNPRLLETLGNDYGSRLFVFIGQVDIVMAQGTSQLDIQRENYMREIRVHYTVMRLDGTQAGGGVVSCTFPARQLNLGRIRSRCLNSLADQIVETLPAFGDAEAVEQ